MGTLIATRRYRIEADDDERQRIIARRKRLGAK